MKKNILLLIIGLGVVSGGYLIWHNRAKGGQIYRFTPVTAGNITSFIITSGRVESTHETEIRARIDGLIDRVLVDEGDTVSQNQELIRFDVVDAQNQLEQCQERVNLTEAELKEAKRDWERSESLFKTAMESEVGLEANRTRYKVLQSKNKLAVKDIELARAHLEKLSCISPQDGVVIIKGAEDGQSVIPGQLLLTIADLLNLQIACNVDEYDVTEIEIGNPAIITFDALPDQSFKGKVTKIYPRAQIDKNTTIVKVEVTVMGELPKVIKIGVQADVQIITEEKSNVLHLPPQAIYAHNGQKIAFLYQNGIARMQTVKTGTANNQQVEILSGLTEGERVIIQGDRELKDGTKVRIE